MNLLLAARWPHCGLSQHRCATALHHRALSLRRMSLMRERHAARRPQVRAAAAAPTDLRQAYDHCKEITSSFAKTFYFATAFQPEDKAKSIYAIYAWCRLLDETIDGVANQHRSAEELESSLDEIEERLSTLWGQDESVNAADKGTESDADLPLETLALMDTVRRTPDLQAEPFRDMLKGMRMDVKPDVRYRCFEDLYTYCYRVAGTVGLMTIPVLGTAPGVEFDDAAEPGVALGIALQLTNIIRDVGEDIGRKRIYIPQDDMDTFGVQEQDLAAAKGLRPVGSGRYEELMEFEIQRALAYYAQAEAGVKTLAPSSRLPVLAALLLYKKILTGVRENGYDNITKRAYTSKTDKLMALPSIWWQATTAPEFDPWKAASVHWLGLPPQRRDCLHRLMTAMAMDDEEGVKALVDTLLKVNPTHAPGSSDLLPGTWELLWSSPSSDYSRLRRKLDGSVLPVTSSSKQVIGEGFSQNTVEVGGAVRIVINAAISPETTDNTGITTAVGPPYTFEINLGPVKIPLKFPPEFGDERTSLETLYLDDCVKVSRVGPYGERTTPGSLFIHVRK